MSTITNINCDELFIKYKESLFSYMRCAQNSHIHSHKSEDLLKNVNRTIHCELDNYLYFTKYRCYDHGALTVQDYASRYKLNVKKYRDSIIEYSDNEVIATEQYNITKKFI